MAGTTITITAESSSAIAAINRVERAVSDMTTFFRDVGESLLISTRARQAQEVDPSGAPWTPLSPEYLAFKTRKRPGVKMLVFDFHMLGDMLSYDAGPDFVQIGSYAVYAAIHQFGGVAGRPPPTLSDNPLKKNGRAKIPARPFLGLSTQDEETIVAKANRYVQEAADGSSQGAAL